LDKYTFKIESKFKDIEFAKRVYTAAVNRHLKYGSTTTTFFGTIHLGATKYLADLVAQSGQRGFVGKINMDRNSPQFYCEDTKQSIMVQFEPLHQELSMYSLGYRGFYSIRFIIASI